MDALIPALVACALAEAGGRMQLLVAALARRYGRAGPVVAGAALAAILVMALGAAIGVVVAREIPHSAAKLLAGIALILAGGGALFRPKPAPDVSTWRLGAFPSSAGAALILGFGEAAQFVAAALSAASGEPVAVGAGAALGVTVACVPPALLAGRWGGLGALRAVRTAAGALLLVAGAAVAILALQIA